MLIKPRQLASLGILGINRRNRSYIGRYNQRRYYPLVDDKLRTKKMAQQHGVATPVLRFVIRYQSALRTALERMKQLDNFVVKPAKGSGGKGILVIERRRDDVFIKPSGEELSLDDVYRHISNILAGLYSLGGQPDTALVEDLVVCEPKLGGFAYKGVPDIRIIIFQGYPVMAMLRLPTRASDGKANLHQGAVGVGLDIGSGCYVNAVQQSCQIIRHPDNDRALSEIIVADWQRMLTLAAGCYELTQLGYIGVDMVVDRTHGAQLLELNARPGLAIQIANNAGLIPRLTHIETLASAQQSVSQRVDYVRNQFAVT